jgi:hypothetical protein
MAIIYSYQKNINIQSTDILIGTSTAIVKGKIKNQTKSFSVGDLSVFIAELVNPTLDDVLLNGNTSLLNANIGQLGLYDTTEDAYGILRVSDSEFQFQDSNGIATTQSRNGITFFKDGVIGGSILLPTYATSHQYSLPDQDGVIALLQDTTIQAVLDNNNIASDVSLILNNVGAPGSEFSSSSVSYNFDSIDIDTEDFLTSTSLSAKYAYNQAFINLSSLDNVFETSLGFGNIISSWSDGGANSRRARLDSGSSTLGPSFELKNLGSIVKFKADNVLGSKTLNLQVPDKAAGSYTLATIEDIPPPSAYVPPTRELTINGTTYDLEQDRTWDIKGGFHSVKKLITNQSTSAAINGVSGSFPAVAQTANKMTVYPYLPFNNVVSASLYINVTLAVAASNAKILVYYDSDGYPGDLLYASANLDTSSIGIKAATLVLPDLPINFLSGQTYWIGLWTSAAISVSGIAVANSVSTHINVTTNYNSITYSTTFGTPPNQFPDINNTTNATSILPFVGITSI